MRVFAAAWLSVALGCSGDDGPGLPGDGPEQLADGPTQQQGPQLPHVTPPVRAALPPGLGGTAASFLNANDIKTRFFMPGPTDIYSILEGIDGRIDDINQRSGDCTTQDPVAYTVEAWGQSLTAYAQCTGGLAPGTTYPNFMEFGTAPDGSTWINNTIANSTTLVQLTPIASDQFAVHVWLTIPIDSVDCTQIRGSYGAVELTADASTSSFEMVVAGTGMGYCGAQLKSDGTSIFVTGSVDPGVLPMGVNNCDAIDSVCGAASDISQPATCGASTTSFTLPSIGRTAIPSCFGASHYPASGNAIDLSGTATDTIQTFQTTAPAPGVGLI